MLMASSNDNGNVLDPFSGSGTTMRVCQQLNRHAVGFELNPDYIELTKLRLKEPFNGFDSVDPRMERVPNDLGKVGVRDKYLENHKNWFLKNHENSLEVFKKVVHEKYGVEIDSESKNFEQEELF